MRILCTGAAGFIGRHTFPILGQAGHDVSCLDRSWPKDWVPGLSYPMSSYKTDITNLEAVTEVFELTKPDSVLHLAANSSLQKGIEDPVYDAENNIIGTINVLQAAKEHGCRRIVFASTSAVYSATYADVRIESDPIEPITPYGISKAACEIYIKASGLDYAILRYANVYGPGQKPLGENILIARALTYFSEGAYFRINGDGQQTRDWIYVGDVAQANLMALESDIVNLVANISTNEGISVVDIVRKIWGLHFQIAITKSDWPPFGPLIQGELRHVIMKNIVAEKVLGWKPNININEGLKRTVEAWKKERHGLSAGV